MTHNSCTLRTSVYHGGQIEEHIIFQFSIPGFSNPSQGGSLHDNPLAIGVPTHTVHS